MWFFVRTFFYWTLQNHLRLQKILMRKLKFLCGEKLKSYVDKHLDLAKVNVPKLLQPLSIPERLAEIQIVDDDSYRVALSISKDDDFELSLKRKPSSCFVTNDSMMSWKPDKKIWTSNLFPTITKQWHVLIPFTKWGPVLTRHERRNQGSFWEQSLLLWNNENNSISLLSKRECSVQGGVYNILPELILRRVFPV